MPWVHRSKTVGNTESQAIFSDCGRYRYMLSRHWDDNLPTIVFIMLNPSTGDENKLEPTTTGVVKRAKNWGYGSIIVYNLFGLIATNPIDLYDNHDPIGPYTDSFLDDINVMHETLVVCAWGRHGAFRNRDSEVISRLHVPLYALEFNKDGSPRHPLHMAHSIKPKLWEDVS